MIKDKDKSLRILVVDDYPLTRDMVRSILKQIGFNHIVTADDGLSAIRTICEGAIDLVICDWNMPNCSGLEVLKRIRSEERFLNLPFLMLTAEAYRENVQEAARAGVHEYIVKPFTAQILAEKIESVLERRKS